MVLLAIASVWSWAIMLDKAFTFAGLNRRADSFLGVFRSSSSLDDVYQKVAKEKNNPLVNIFLAGMNELRVSLDPGAVPSDHLREHVEERVTTSMEMVEARESERLGSGMGVLATVGSTSPFSACSARSMHHGQLPRHREFRHDQPRGRGSWYCRSPSDDSDWSCRRHPPRSSCITTSPARLAPIMGG